MLFKLHYLCSVPTTSFVLEQDEPRGDRTLVEVVDIMNIATPYHHRIPKTIFLCRFCGMDGIAKGWNVETIENKPIFTLDPHFLTSLR